MVKTSDDEIVDRALRASCSEMGSRVGMCAKPTTTQFVRDYGVLNTTSLAWRIGRAIAKCEATNSLSLVAESIIEETGGPAAAKVLFRGKIVAVERRLYKGHSHGAVHIAAFDQGDEEDEAAGNSLVRRAEAVVTGGKVKIPFKNENIFVEHTAEDGTVSFIATVPDLIAVIDNGSGRALGVPEFKYGYHVTVIGIACSPRWTDTEFGIEVGGPKAFGYSMPYKALGTYVEPRSVIEEFKAAP